MPMASVEIPSTREVVVKSPSDSRPEGFLCSLRLRMALLRRGNILLLLGFGIGLRPLGVVQPAEQPAESLHQRRPGIAQFYTMGHRKTLQLFRPDCREPYLHLPPVIVAAHPFDQPSLLHSVDQP